MAVPMVWRLAEEHQTFFNWSGTVLGQMPLWWSAQNLGKLCKCKKFHHQKFEHEHGIGGHKVLGIVHDTSNDMVPIGTVPPWAPAASAQVHHSWGSHTSLRRRILECFLNIILVQAPLANQCVAGARVHHWAAQWENLFCSLSARELSSLPDFWNCQFSHLPVFQTFFFLAKRSLNVFCMASNQVLQNSWCAPQWCQVTLLVSELVSAAGGFQRTSAVISQSFSMEQFSVKQCTLLTQLSVFWIFCQAQKLPQSADHLTCPQRCRHLLFVIFVVLLKAKSLSGQVISD